MNNLKDELKDFYSSQELSNKQLERLQGKKSFRNFWTIGSGLVAACALIIFIFNTQNYEMKVMKEIVYNHNKNLSIEISSNDIKVIQEGLPKIDFTLTLSTHLPKEEWKILGARYCSIQGKIAAQIKIQNIKTGEKYTFYQSKMAHSFSKSKDSIDGAHVKIWEEKGLLMGIAGP